MDWKRIKHWIIFCVVLFLGGAFSFFLELIIMLGSPMYLKLSAPWVIWPVWVGLTLSCSKLLNAKWLKRLWLLVLCAAVCGGVQVARFYYIKSVPTVEDRDLAIWDYMPYEEETLAARLEEPSALRFDKKTAQALRLDGATALYPVYAAFVQAVYPEGEYPIYKYITNGYGARRVSGLVTCSGTSEAYERLCSGETDIIFVAAPSQNQLDRAHELGMELYLTPIGREAFVFFVNSGNPVTGLTVEEVQGIYTGKITNWRQVGGENRSILPYQRQANSGSQTALLRLMDGLPLIEPTEEQVSGHMGGIIEQVADYRNFPNAIGFSFRFYATEMVRNGGIRLLALNGVEPTKETIRDGSYPISDYFYAVTAGPIGEAPPQELDRNMAAFLEWMSSAQGQTLVERSGYVPVM